MDPPASMKAAIDQFRARLRSPAEYQVFIDKLNSALAKLRRRRGRPRRRRLPRGGSSRSQSDTLVIIALENMRAVGSRRCQAKDICDYIGLPLSTVHRTLVCLESRGLVTKHGRPREWSLISDRRRVESYESSRLYELKWTKPISLRDAIAHVLQRLRFEKCLVERGDAAIREYLLHHRDPEGFMREQEREQRQLTSYLKFAERESKRKTTPYLERQKEYRQF